MTAQPAEPQALDFAAITRAIDAAAMDYEPAEWRPPTHDERLLMADFAHGLFADERFLALIAAAPPAPAAQPWTDDAFAGNALADVVRDQAPAAQQPATSFVTTEPGPWSPIQSMPEAAQQPAQGDLVQRLRGWVRVMRDVDTHNRKTHQGAGYGSKLREVTSEAVDEIERLQQRVVDVERAQQSAVTRHMNLLLDLGRLLDGEAPINGFPEVQRLSERLATAERERDEARAERDLLLTAYPKRAAAGEPPSEGVR